MVRKKRYSLLTITVITLFGLYTNIIIVAITSQCKGIHIRTFSPNDDYKKFNRL